MVASVGASFQCAAQDVDWMIASHVVTGFGTEMIIAIISTYAGEMADYISRGQFIAMEFTLDIFGVVVAYWVSGLADPRLTVN